MYYYTYRINFVDLYYYIGKRTCYCPPAEDIYWGTPITHKDKWNTTMFWKEITGVWESAEILGEQEKKQIEPYYKSDPFCLNMNCGGNFGGSSRSCSEEIKNTILERLKQGEPRGDIAEDLGVSLNIVRYLHQTHLPGVRVKAFSKKWKRTNSTRTYPKQNKNSRGIGFASQIIPLLFTLKSSDEIARQVGCSRCTVNLVKKYHKNGFYVGVKNIPREYQHYEGIPEERREVSKTEQVINLLNNDPNLSIEEIVNKLHISRKLVQHARKKMGSIKTIARGSKLQSNIINLHADGYKPLDISKELKCSLGYVYSVLKRHQKE